MSSRAAAVAPVMRIRNAGAIGVGVDAANRVSAATKAVGRPARKMAVVVGRDAVIVAERKVAKKLAEESDGPVAGAPVAGTPVVGTPVVGSLVVGSLVVGSRGAVVAARAENGAQNGAQSGASENRVASGVDQDAQLQVTCGSRSSTSWWRWT